MVTETKTRRHSSLGPVSAQRVPPVLARGGESEKLHLAKRWSDRSLREISTRHPNGRLRGVAWEVTPFLGVRNPETA